MNDFASNRPRIKSKWIEVREINSADKLVLEPGQRIVDTKIIGETVSLPRTGTNTQFAMPSYKTVIVLECIEFEERER